MRTKIVLWAAFCLAVIPTGRVLATQSEQSSSPIMEEASPPKVLWIFREEVKPGRGALHDNVESGYAQLWEKAGIQPYLGFDALSGDNESVFISAYASFATFERDQKIINEISSGPWKNEYNQLAGQESSLVDRIRSSIAVLQPELSYLGDRFHNRLAKARYMEVESFQVRPGKDESFVEGAKMYQEAYRRLNIDDPWLVYRVISGNDSGTYMVFASMKSMADMDTHFARESSIHKEMGEKMDKMMQSSNEVFTSMHTNLYRINPMTSHPPKEFAAADPTFWNKPKASIGEMSLARTDFPMDRESIRRVQDALNSLGYSCGTADGFAGSQTRSALRRFQKANGLTVTGDIDSETTHKLGARF
jgi:hypothetical protein